MAEYIERETLWRAFEYESFYNNADRDEIVLPKIDSFPAADVAPVRHGRWKYYRKQGIAVCTRCSFERKLDDNFGRAVSCPNCGARMGGDSDA